MPRIALILLPAVVLSACAPEVPDSAAGVGFNSYSEYVRSRDAAQAAGLVPGPAISTERIGTATPPAAIAVAPLPAAPQPAAPVAALPADRPRADTIAGIAPQSGETRHYSGGSTAAISDEQNFDAVASRESIQSDAERLRAQRQQYVVVEPTALPERSGPAGPNIVEFALSTRHAPGTAAYRRSALRLTSYERACGGFTSADLAQEAFLARGGPERDPMGVDPDGDGFACGWDPRPFRAALR
jgi:hypothetical protein